MSRITVAELREAYAKCGKTPIRGNYKPAHGAESCDICALGAMYLASGGGGSENMFTVEYIAHLNDRYTVQYLQGFWRGVGRVRVILNTIRVMLTVRVWLWSSNLRSKIYCKYRNGTDQESGAESRGSYQSGRDS